MNRLENEKGVIRSIDDVEKNFTLRLSDGRINCKKAENLKITGDF